MIMNQALNKKQLVVAWIMILSIVLMMIYTISGLRRNPVDINVFFNVYFAITAVGLLLLYILGKRKKSQA